MKDGKNRDKMIPLAALRIYFTKGGNDESKLEEKGKSRTGDGFCTVADRDAERSAGFGRTGGRSYGRNTPAVTAEVYPKPQNITIDPAEGMNFVGGV